MSWTLQRRDRVAVVTMTTNKVNAADRAFFSDVQDAWSAGATCECTTGVAAAGG